MTITVEPDATTTEPEAATPEPLTFEVGHIKITAASEEEALRKYKRLVRAEGLKAQIANDWCDSGTNDKLVRLGLRRKGEGIPVRVRLVAERIAYMVLDVDTEDEADELLASGEDPETLELATAAIGRGWKAQVVEKAAPREGEYKVGDPDDTTSAMRIGHDGAYVPACEQYSSARGYCTKPRGHVEAGDRQHVVGNGHVIVGVWNHRAS